MPLLATKADDEPGMLVVTGFGDFLVRVTCPSCSSSAAA